MTSIGRNDPCPCGSGRKYKKCCLAAGKSRVVGFTSAERASALEKLAELAEFPELAEVAHDADREFWEGVPDVAAPDEAEMGAMSEFASDFYLFFDVEIEDGHRVVDLLLEADSGLTRGERAFLEAGRATTMRLYEVASVRPGASITLRDLLSGAEITVRELTASQHVHRWDVLAARVFPMGASGLPELDGGLFPISRLRREGLVETLRLDLAEFLEDNPDAGEREFFETLPPFFHAAWRVPPTLPKLVNFDGDPLLLTTAYFDVLDAAGLVAALDAAAPDLERTGQGTTWSWLGQGADRKESVSFGSLQLHDDRLELFTNSSARAERGRALVERIAGGLARFRVAKTQDPEQAMSEMRAQGGPNPREELPPEIREQAEQAIGQFKEEHYRRWLDEELPALDGHTPRHAASSDALRPRLREMLKDLERAYEEELESGDPAFDPSWLRDELGLADESAELHPPPLGHETMDALVPGLGDCARQIADRVRAQSGDDPERTISRDELTADLGFHRFVRAHAHEVARDADEETAVDEATLVASHIELRANFELHLRKVLWVGEAVSWMLGATDLDVRGDVLRPPFASFALVFTDRYALGLAERMLSREPPCRLRGRMLSVVTAYVTQLDAPGDATGLRIAFTCDALDGEWPYLLSRELVVKPDADLGTILDSHFPDVDTAELAPIFSCRPLRELLHLVLNAILYATSADARRDERAPPDASTPRAPGSRAFSSETVFHLPGTIDISALRAIQRARRGASDREQVHGCMVRGHWRRAGKRFKDQRPRWIKPYWRGPTAAAIVERQYRLEP